MDISIASLDDIKTITSTTCFLSSSYRLLDGYFSSSTYEAKCQTPTPSFVIKIDTITTYLIKIISLNKVNSSLCFNIFQIVETEKCFSYKAIFEKISTFLINEFNVSRIYTYILSSEIEHLTIVSKTMSLEASLEEQVFVDNNYLTLNIYAYNLR